MCRNFFAFITLLLATLFLVSGAPASAADDSGKPPKVKFDTDKTPLQAATDLQIEDRKKSHDGTGDDCDQAVKGHKDDDIIKHCKVPKVTKKAAVLSDICPPGGCNDTDKKPRGKRVDTETTYECETAEHCGLTQWPGYTV